MKVISNILVIIDPTTDNQPALIKAAQLARSVNARLQLFLCDYESSLAPKGHNDSRRQAREAFVAKRYAVLGELSKPLERSGLEVSIDVGFFNPLYQGIVEHVERVRPDLVMKDTNYHPLIARTLLTNTDWHLIRCCPAPLLLTRPMSWSPDHRIVAALDPLRAPIHARDTHAHLDEEILDWGTTLSGILKGELHSLHIHFPESLAAQIPAVAYGGTPVNVEEIVDADVVFCRGQVKALTDAFKIPTHRVHVAMGLPAHTLPSEAGRLKADILVLGAISRTHIQHYFVGSTAERILDKLPCDILVIKPPDFSGCVL